MLVASLPATIFGALPRTLIAEKKDADDPFVVAIAACPIAAGASLDRPTLETPQPRRFDYQPDANKIAAVPIACCYRQIALTELCAE